MYPKLFTYIFMPACLLEFCLYLPYFSTWSKQSLNCRRYKRQIRHKRVKLKPIKNNFLRKHNAHSEYFFQIKRIAYTSFCYVNTSKYFFILASSCALSLGSFFIWYSLKVELLHKRIKHATIFLWHSSTVALGLE